MHREEGALHFRLRHHVPLRLSRGEDGALAETGRVIDKNIDPAEGGDRGIDQALCVVCLADIRVAGDGLPALLPDLVRRRLCVAAHRDELLLLRLRELV